MEMMPEAAEVIAAARAFIASEPMVPDSYIDPLKQALDRLDVKLASIGAEPTRVEQDRTWGEVVAGDEIWSTKTLKWYEVHTSVRTQDGQMKVMIKGNPKPIIRPATAPVRVRRGVDGEAVDILEVLFSGTTAPTQAPALDETAEADDE